MQLSMLVGLDDVLKFLVKVYPRNNVSLETLAAMREALHDAPAPLLLEAAHRHVVSSRWFPTVAELLEQVQVVREHREALADVRRHERLAWERQLATERPCPPLHDPRCRQLKVYYSDEELYQMEVAQGTMPPPDVVAKRDKELAQEAARLRKAMGVGGG